MNDEIGRVALRADVLFAGAAAPYMQPMHTRNPFLDQFAKLSTAAIGVAQAAGEEAKSMARAQADRVAAEMDLVRRDEYEALKAEVAALRAQLERLTADQPG